MSTLTQTPRPLDVSGSESQHTTQEMDAARKKRDTKSPPDFSWLYRPLATEKTP